MAEDQQDDAQKTEEPTQKRLREAHEKGQVAKSQEVSHWFMILAFAVIVGFFAPSIAGGLGRALVGFIERPHTLRLDGGSGLQGMMGTTLGAVALALAAPMVVLLLAALLASLIQNGFVLSHEQIKPKLEKLSLAKGFKRLFSLRALSEFAKGLAKLAIVGSVVAVLLWPERDTIPSLAGIEVIAFLGLVKDLALRVLIGVLAVMTVIAGLDFLFQRYQHMKQLRMSKQDLKDEFKQTEGDPMIKARLRQIRGERARQRMMAAVPEADVVVTNPTHFAVALRYRPGEDSAPRLTAKGVDSLALRMRALAEEHKVPVLANPPLARALHKGVELDQQVPVEHYKAVAEIIGYVMRLKGKKIPGQVG